MSLPLLTAVTPRYEAQLTTKLGNSRTVHVVRRCADLAELLGAAEAGVGRVAVVSAELRGLDRSAIHQLLERGLLVLGVHRPDDESGERMLRRWGVPVVVAADADQALLDAALSELTSPQDAPGDPRDQRDPRHLPDQSDGGPPGERAPGVDGSHGTGEGAQGSDQRPQGSDPRPQADRAGGTQGEDGDGAISRSHRDTVSTADGAIAGAQALVRAAARPDDESGAVGDRGHTDPDDGRPGRVVAVWGPVGAPGRTTVAVNIAAELAEPSDPVILADLDTYGAAVAQVLAVLDEAPGVAAAARAADQGRLGPETLTRLAPEVAPGLRVLTGMPRPDRWTELREHAVQDVLAACAALVPLTVVDTGFCLESDEELSFDTSAPRRNGATLAALEVADQVVVVGSADPVSLQRLVRGLDQLRDVTSAPTTVVVNRLRAGAVGKDPARRVREALDRFAGVEDVVVIAEDLRGLDAALLAGRTLREAHPSSPARVGLRELAGRVGGRALTPPHRRRLPRRSAPV